MKQGKSLIELAQELERQAEAKHDYLVKSDSALLADNGKDLQVQNGEVKSFELTELAHNQLGDRVGIPRKFYDKLQKDFPALLATNVNTLLPRQADSFLLRSLDGKGRAILSNKFRCLDNKPLVETVLPILMQGGFKIASSEVTETRLYLKFVSDNFTADLKTLGTIRAGFWFRNSEVGHSRLAGGLFLENLVCTNGMMLTKDYGFARNHTGKALDFSEAVESYFSVETRQIDDRAYWAKVKDVVSGMIGSKEGFQAACKRIEDASKVELNLTDVSRLEDGVKEIFTLTQAESNGVLQHLIKGGDTSLWGLSNALTRYSQDVDDYDRASDFETFGAQVIELPSSHYSTIVN